MDRRILFQRLLFPPLWLLAVLLLFTATVLPLLFICGLSMTIPAYGCYVIAFYTLCTVAARFIQVLPGLLRRGKARIYANPTGSRYLTDAGYKIRVGLSLSLGLNLLYIGINILSWFHNRSAWFIILAVYYTILAVMHVLLVRCVQHSDPGKNILAEWKRARLCAWILLTLNFILTGAVLMILYQGKGFHYPGVLIYVMALYTFYTTISTLVNLFRCRKYHSPIMTASNSIALSAALVSMLALETAMFAQFGADFPPAYQRLMIALTGGGISIAIIALAVSTLMRSTKQIKEMQRIGRT